MNRSFILTGLLLLGAAGCTNPEVRILTRPGNALVRRDGFPAGHSPMTLEAPYYGKILIDIEKAPVDIQVEKRDGARTTRETIHFKPVTQMVEIPPPASRWVFPADLAFEFLYRILGVLDRTIDVRLEVQEAPKSLDDAGAARLIEESKKASIWR